MTERRANSENVSTTKEAMIERFVVPYTDNILIFNAFTAVDRMRFAPSGFEKEAYNNYPLPFGDGAKSTISTPQIQAVLMDKLALDGSGRVLEVGTASGFGAALLGHCAEEVFTIEHDEELAGRAEFRIHEERVPARVEVIVGDGAMGYESASPYDRIVVTAGCKVLPSALVDQLAEGGRIVAPVGDRSLQNLIVARKMDGELTVEEADDEVVFVPLISDAHGGWRSGELEKVSAMDDATLQQLLDVLREGGDINAFIEAMLLGKNKHDVSSSSPLDR